MSLVSFSRNEMAKVAATGESVSWMSRSLFFICYGSFAVWVGWLTPSFLGTLHLLMKVKCSLLLEVWSFTSCLLNLLSARVPCRDASRLQSSLMV